MSQFSDTYKKQLKVGSTTYAYASLEAVEANTGSLAKLPVSLRVLAENIARHGDDEQLSSFSKWLQSPQKGAEISFRPARVLMQDFTGVPAIVDLAAMRDAVAEKGKDPKKINPLSPVDLVIDHSVMVDKYASPEAFEENVRYEFERNRERYAFLRWGQDAFDNFRVVPPGTGICHQVNLEYLAKTVWTKETDGTTWAYPDTLVGTDSHTTMINALGVLGWGVGGIEAEAAMLGQPVSMLLPEVIGFYLEGGLKEGATATDLVLTITHMLREKGVVAKFVEFYGPGVGDLSLADRATISNMSPEFGATCAFFPVDDETLKYLAFTGRSPEQVALVEAYAKAQGLWHTDTDLTFSDTLSLNLETVEPTIAGPKRPQDKVLLREGKEAVLSVINADQKEPHKTEACSFKGEDFTMGHGDVVIAAITSCTNTSNPSVMVGAGLLARKAKALGLKPKPWVKTSFAPGSKVVTSYLEAADLMTDLEGLGFHLVGYGCTTCIGNSGPLAPEIEDTVTKGDLAVGAVLSGNRNFEGRIHPLVKLSYLASPPLVVAYALAGTLKINLAEEALGVDKEGNPVYLKDIWPTPQEVSEVIRQAMTPEMFQREYAQVFTGDEIWKGLSSGAGLTYDWEAQSTYVKKPPFFEEQGRAKQDGTAFEVGNARVLAILGDSVTTDHISPAGAIKIDSPAGLYLQERGIETINFNSYGSRRGNHEIMMRGTFSNIRLQNLMTPEKKGGFTCLHPEGERLPIYDAAMIYQERKTPLVIFAGRDYGAGSSRDWAAKGTRLLGVKTVIAQSFERIHRSNLIGMGVLPLQFPEGISHQSLGLTGEEEVSISSTSPDGRIPGERFTITITSSDGKAQTVETIARLDTPNEVAYFNHGGILNYVLEGIAAA